MAEDADVQKVNDLLPADAETEGWNEEKITTYLDAEGGSVYEVLITYWEGKAAATWQMIDVNESGSSRSLSKIHDNAERMAGYWRERLQRYEESIEKEDLKTTTTIGKIKRV